MKVSSFLLVFVLGAAVGAGAHWYATQPRSRDIVTSAKEDVRETAHNIGDSVKHTVENPQLKEDINRVGRAVRDQAVKAGEAVADATGNMRITTAVKTKLVADTGLSAFKIDVDTTDGVVTLSGTVASPTDIANAMKIAQDTEGVHRVVSTLIVKP